MDKIEKRLVNFVEELDTVNDKRRTVESYLEYCRPLVTVTA
jgi:hypothetical protein